MKDKIISNDLYSFYDVSTYADPSVYAVHNVAGVRVATLRQENASNQDFTAFCASQKGAKITDPEQDLIEWAIEAKGGDLGINCRVCGHYENWCMKSCLAERVRRERKAKRLREERKAKQNEVQNHSRRPVQRDR